MRKLTAFFLFALFFIMPFSSLAVEMPPPQRALEEIEISLYGEANPGPFATRLGRIEEDIFGKVNEGAFVARIADAYNYVKGESFPEGSVKLRLNVIEWALFKKLSSVSVITRLNEIEQQFYGEKQLGTIFSRVNKISSDIFPAGTFRTESIKIPAGTIVIVNLDTTLDSEKTNAGAVVSFTVAEDIKVNGKVVIPAGRQGRGSVLNVSPSGNLGKGGSMEISFTNLEAIDETNLKVGMTDRTIKEFNSKNQNIVASPSVDGAVIFNQGSLSVGFFVKGKELVIPSGIKLSLEVRYDVLVTGVYF